MTDPTAEDAGEPAALAARLTDLEERGAGRFRPVRLCYIRALIGRAGTARPPVAAALGARAAAALAAYQADFQRAGDEAQALSAHLTSLYPAAALELQALCEQGDFSALHALAERLQRSPGTTPLRVLTAWLEREDEPDEGALEGAALDECLRAQERAAIAAAEQRRAEEGLPPPATGPGRELRSLRSLREALASSGGDQQLARAIQQCPANSGPLNPQLLATRSLTLMRELSPHYLRRFVGYMDTLDYLEAADAAQEEPRAAGERRKGGKGASMRKRS